MFCFASSTLFHLFFTSNCVVFVDRGRKNIFCSRALPYSYATGKNAYVLKKFRTFTCKILMMPMSPFDLNCPCLLINQHFKNLRWLVRVGIFSPNEWFCTNICGIIYENPEGMPPPPCTLTLCQSVSFCIYRCGL